MIDAMASIKPQGDESLVQGKVQDLQATMNRGEIRQASEKFESYFISYLLKVMRSTIPKGVLTQNPMGDVYYSFYDEEIGKRAAEVGGIGLSDMILSTLAKDSAAPPSNQTKTVDHDRQ